MQAKGIDVRTLTTLEETPEVHAWVFLLLILLCLRPFFLI